MKKILFAIVIFLIIDQLRIIVQNYGIDNTNDINVSIAMGFVSLLLSILFVVIVGKLFSKHDNKNK